MAGFECPMSTPKSQLPTPNQFPTPNSQNFGTQKANHANSQFRKPKSAWELGVGSQLGVGSWGLGVDKRHRPGASEFPGPKCFRITRGSDSPRFSTRTP